MKKGFTLIEMLTVIAIIAGLTAIIIPSVSSVRAKGRNAQRSTDISTMINAVYQYSVDNNNQLPVAITTTTNEICKTAAPSCVGLADLSVLTVNQKYLPVLPVDPTSTSTNGTGYTIAKNTFNRVVISAPRAESGATITITR